MCSCINKLPHKIFYSKVKYWDWRLQKSIINIFIMEDSLMKKTKIICTMGPNTNDRELIKQLALAGMDIALMETKKNREDD